MTKETLLKELQSNSWVMLKPSPIEGIGVFAIRSIPRGCRDMFSKAEETDEWITLSKEEVANLPEHAKQLVENYCLYDEEVYFVPGHGFKKIDVSLFLNHSDTPNIISIDDGEYFEAIVEIGCGEELFIDYGRIVNGD